ncbi:hypothetical protein TWF225_008590 [Orbilia oligospora]|uniref:Uncharacterized protein n=1 Tax=Orbilia oligospora TaxID=2813651 RepID=A0A7C8PDC8_ORBOL|nr:hypothetical protein TWF751_010492 [Orbilia oligospora]KAF3176941.1 hypothetical protein TWF225_008590 [Orbilia oligospora]KAF3254388.1 hypothetical protein TWF128_006186 [Orbilia oligospora]KAF3255440.1 hypothetical protein TWF217_006611 [Orbilia oligospora]KAF3295744.1 hypothetical protein TWF132_001066 [Orbilia oligospora]
MKLKYWISGLLVLAEAALCESRKTSATSTAPPQFTNALGDFNRALDPSAVSPYNPEQRSKLDVWKRSAITPRQDDDLAPTDPKFDRWLRPPEGPHQVFGCINKGNMEGLSTVEMKKTGRYLMWQLEKSFLAFKTQSTDSENPCFPVFCYEEFNATVAMCNKRSDMANTITIHGYEIGRLVWEMGVAVGFDYRHLIQPWEGSKRICENPESEENGKLLTGSYVAWTGWSEDEWEVTISKDADGCRKWRGNPNWVTTGKGMIPEELPLDIF